VNHDDTTATITKKIKRRLDQVFHRKRGQGSNGDGGDADDEPGKGGGTKRDIEGAAPEGLVCNARI
jgi:hypothetical protein